VAVVSKTIRVGTRGSALARQQTGDVVTLLQAAWPDLVFETTIITTSGDRQIDMPLSSADGKGLFTSELEAALLRREIDLAVHSLKDLPTQITSGLVVGATPERANPADILISRGGQSLDALPSGSTIGTSSRRRSAQLLNRRPDLRMEDIRGNVDTRIRKALDPAGPYDAIVLAYAGLQRLGKLDMLSNILNFDEMLPAPGQGVLGVQCRDDAEMLSLLHPINDRETQIAATAERAFLAKLEGGCALPVAALGVFEDGELYLRGRVTAPDGAMQIDVESRTAVPTLEEAQTAGRALAQAALERGAAKLLETVR
jgi:hydroxymethylbilane synthase